MITLPLKDKAGLANQTDDVKQFAEYTHCLHASVSVEGPRPNSREMAVNTTMASWEEVTWMGGLWSPDF